MSTNTDGIMKKVTYFFFIYNKYGKVYRVIEFENIIITKKKLKCVACWSVVLFVLYQGCCDSIYLPVEEQHYNKYLVPLYRKGGTNIPQLKVF